MKDTWGNKLTAWGWINAVMHTQQRESAQNIAHAE